MSCRLDENGIVIIIEIWGYINLDKKKSRWSKFRKTYLKLLVSFLAFAILVFIVSFYIYGYSTNLLRNEFKSKLETNFKHNISELDSSLTLNRSSLISIFYNPDHLQFFQPYEKMPLDVQVNIKQIINVMSSAKTISSSYMDSVFYYLDDKKVYNRDGADDFITFFTKFHVYEGYNDDYWKEKLVEYNLEETIGPVNLKIPVQIISAEKKIIAYQLTVIVNGNKIILVIDFDYDKIINAITINSLFLETGYIVLDNSNNVVYYTAPGNLKENRFENAVYNNDITHNINTIYNNKEYFICESNINLFGYKVLAVTPVRAFDKYLSNILIILVSSCFVFAITSLVLVMLFTNSIYRPVNKISEFVAGNIGDKLAHKRDDTEFDMIRAGIEYLVEQSNSYKDNMLRVAEEFVKTSVINAINTGAPMNQMMFEILFGTQIKNEVISIKPEHSKKYFCCVTIIFRFAHSFLERSEEGNVAYIFRSLKTIISSIFNEYMHCTVIEYEQGKFICVIGSFDEDINSKVKNAAKRMEESFLFNSEYYNFFIGVGGTSSDICQIKQSYIEAATALVKAHTSSGERIVYIGEGKTSDSIDLSREDELKIGQLLQSCELDPLMNIIEELTKRNMSNFLAHDKMLLFFTRLIEIGCSFMENMNYDCEDYLSIFADKIRGRIELVEPDYSDKIIFVMDFYGIVIEKHKKELNRSISNLVENVKNYISKNYFKNISLESTAIQFNVSPKYLSRCFKEQQDINFTDFLNYARIKNAERLLKETDMKIHEVAEAVGLPSKTTFVRLFKKYTSLVPRDYKRYLEVK